MPGELPSAAARSRPGTVRRRLSAPSPSRTTTSADLTAIARPKAVSQRSSTAPSSSSDCAIPPSSSTATAISASDEKRPIVAASSVLRSAGASRRVAAGSAETSTASPPIHAPAASTWSTFAGSRTATGS